MRKVFCCITICYLLSVHLNSSSYIPRGEDGRWMLKNEDDDELYLDLDDEVFFKFSVQTITISYCH